MPTRADIIVSGDFDADWQLVVEVKRRSGVETEAEDQLRKYLQGYNCPMGLLVTLDDIRVFRETYASTGPESVERVAVHPLPDELRSQAESPVAFERAVQHWLERLAVSGTGIVADEELAATLDEHIIPVLRDGSIYAGGPRWTREAVAR